MTGVQTCALPILQVWGFRRLEATLTGLVAVVVLAFGLEMLRSRPSVSGMAHGLFVPAVSGSGSALLAVSIIGATVMPHVIYLHSSLTQNRIVGANPDARRRIFRFEMVDITIAMGVAGVINLAMLATAAAVVHARGLFGAGNDLGVVFNGLNRFLGAHSGLVFGLALLASGLASSCVGTMSGQVVMQGFIHKKIPIFARRAITMIPALILIGAGFSPAKTWPRLSPALDKPRVWKTAAAVASMARLITPATPIAIMMSTISNRKILRRASGLAPTMRFWVSEECK